MIRTRILLALTLAMIPGLAAGEYTTIDDLAKAYSVDSCQACHAKVHAEWQSSFHAQSIVHSLGGLRNFIVFGLGQEWRKPVTKENLMRCLECHAPMLKEASEGLIKEVAGLILTAVDDQDEAKKAAARQELAKLSVNCLTCHNAKIAIEKNLRGDPKPGVIYGPRGRPSPAHPTAQAVALGSALFCGQCHGILVPPDQDWVVCNTLYGSYQDGFRAQGGAETCQDCHMKKDGRGHTFPGAYDAAMVREGVGLEVQAMAVKLTPGKWTPTAVVDVGLANRAGHRIPDG